CPVLIPCEREWKRSSRHWRDSMRVEFRRVDWRFLSTFRIANGARTHAETVHVYLHAGGTVGRGEALGVAYRREDADAILAQIAAVKNDLVNGLSRQDLARILPAGGARNAIDCALWDLEAKRAGRRAWELAGLHSVRPLLTAYTLSLDMPAIMRR